MLNSIKYIVLEYYEELISCREHLHANPELSFKEYNTAKFVATKLTDMGIPYTEGIAGTGIVALIKGNNPTKKCIALRADLDALPIQEENDISCKSTVSGVMHACGHDVHTTCLLGAAKVLNSLKSEFEGTIKLIFQPGEEVLPGGASMMISEGVLTNPKVDEIYALHVLPSMEVGKVGFKSGKYMAACDELYLSVIGKGGHAALPNQYNNPIMIMAELLPKLESYIKSLSLVDSPYVFAFGDLQAHGATNVIPEQANAKGTFRSMNETWREEVHHKLRSFVDDFLKLHNASGELKILKGYPFLQNDKGLTDDAFKITQKLLGDDNVERMSIRMTAEDFSYYSQKVPACFFRLGVRNESKGIVYGVHHPKFNIDNEALKVGVSSLTAIALQALSTK
jgi:amidohydrolase